MGELNFLTLDEVMYLHDESLARFGGAAGVREPSLVESALVSARNAYWYGHGGLYEVAAAYAYHLAESQAFFDGNKRTAAASALMFLRKNSVVFPKDAGSVYQAMMAVAKRQLDKTGLAEVLRKLVETKK